MRNLRGALGPVLFVVAAAGICGAPFPASAGSMGSLVPAYFYPGTGGAGGTGDGWAQMATAAAQIPVTAIFNPDSGPLPGPADPNYVNAMTNLENAGGKVVAYVYTNYTNIPLATVEGQISTYLTQYGSLINGFFVDAMTNDNSTGDLAYYHSLYMYIKAMSSSYQVIGNPGTTTAEGYLKPATQGADTLVTYENQSQFYAGTNPPSWVYNYSSSDFANIIYNATSQDMQANIGLAAQRNVGSVYITDQSLPNPYGQLPSYWDQEVSAIASIPEPGTFTMLATGGLLLSVAMTIRGRSRGA